MHPELVASAARLVQAERLRSADLRRQRRLRLDPDDPVTGVDKPAVLRVTGRAGRTGMPECATPPVVMGGAAGVQTGRRQSLPEERGAGQDAA